MISRDDAFLKKFNDLIESHLADATLNVEFLSDTLATSRSSLQRKVKQLTGKSVNQNIRFFRLNKAKNLLENNVGTTSEIAFKVGFHSPSYFIKCFHDHYGHPPGEAKKMSEDRVTNKAIPNNLPIPATRFFGRQNELLQLKKLLGNHRLVTVRGSGGCGKTRLAIEVARQSLNLFPDGVWFAPLSQLVDPSMVTVTLTEVLQVKPVKDRPIEDILLERISGREMLVVLDNCEHLIDECARVLDLLLTKTQIPLFLATSREALNTPGESVFHTPSLPFPETANSLEDIVKFDSIQLFQDRVRMNKPEFLLDENNGAAISSICQKLDGIPLAIEMAASRVKVMDPETILSRLSDQLRILSIGARTASPRQKTLRATIDWSYDLLSENEKVLFHRLSVFAGDFDLGDAEIVCGYHPLSEVEIMDLLTSLVDKSLILTTERFKTTRYSLLELMKQYGIEILSQNDNLSQLQEKYCDYYLKTTRIAYEERVRNGAKWSTWLNLELSNIQGALNMLQNDPKRRLELASYLGDFFFEHSYIGIGHEILNTALEGSTLKNVHQARLLVGMGFLEFYYMNSELGFQKLIEGFDIIQNLPDRQAKVNTYFWLGMAFTIKKNWKNALKILEEGLQIAKVANDPWMEMRYKILITWIPINQLKPELISDEVAENLERAIGLENNFDITVARHIYADVPLQLGDFKESEIRYIEAAKSAMELGSILQTDIEMQGVAMSLSGQGRHEKALRLFGAAMSQFEEIGAELVNLDFWMTCINRTIGKSMELLGPEKSQILDHEGRQMGFENALEYAFDISKD